MGEMTIRKLEMKDYDRVLELNDESVHFLSPLTNDKLD